MATARESHMQSIKRLMEIGKMRKDGASVSEISKRYGVSISRVYMLLKEFNFSTSVEQFRYRKYQFSHYMKKEESKELMHIKDWLEFLTEETK
jgi:transposase